MVFITEEMIRMRAEHNDKEICSLEEVSLHQQNIEKIEHLDRWCRNLKILYLQNNLIPRMENLGHLKKLQYLNLALNNIEVIENLEGCESLEKLDLTVNFVGRLSSVERLKHNPHLTELFLVGNPCTKFQGYREYVVVTLPQLKWLDGAKISRSERIRACQRMEELKGGLQEQEEEHVRRRQRERQEAHIKESRGVTSTPLWVQENQEEDPGLEDRFWNTPCEFSPESRVEAHRHLEEKQRAEENKGKKPKAPRTLVTAEGRPLNINEPKLEFRLTEDDDTNSVVLDLAVYRHMDTSLMDVDVQPTFARVTVKGKIFQVVLPAEVKPDSSVAHRSQTTGHLLLTMSRAGDTLRTRRPASAPVPQRSSSQDQQRTRPGAERLEVDPRSHRVLDLGAIVPRETPEGPLEMCRLAPPTSRTSIPGEGFVDDPDVPPLM
ncbi:dynein axonemal assembly factor 11 isoform X1 [Takifugu rubripes]|uniref:dynein axonemal assembly factor 11 isoform X1 n=1 Tax=Takifugu rubripes TaxID=31033 RepID=UPI001145DBF7|nr:protein tilB homolog isoform X1 [Takifugu rubripes]